MTPNETKTSTTKNTSNRQRYLPVNCDFAYLYRLSKKEEVVKNVARNLKWSAFEQLFNFIQENQHQTKKLGEEELNIIKNKNATNLPHDVLIYICKRYLQQRIEKGKTMLSTFEESLLRQDIQDNIYESVTNFIGHRIFFGITPLWDEIDYKQYIESDLIDPKLSNGMVYTPISPPISTTDDDKLHSWEETNQPWLKEVLARNTPIRIYAELDQKEEYLERGNPPEGLKDSAPEDPRNCSAFSRELAIATSTYRTLTVDFDKNYPSGRVIISEMRKGINISDICNRFKTKSSIIKQCQKFNQLLNSLFEKQEQGKIQSASLTILDDEAVKHLNINDDFSIPQITSSKIIIQPQQNIPPIVTTSAIFSKVSMCYLSQQQSQSPRRIFSQNNALNNNVVNISLKNNANKSNITQSDKLVVNADVLPPPPPTPPPMPM